MPRNRVQAVARYEVTLHLKLRAIFADQPRGRGRPLKGTFCSFKDVSAPRHKKLKHELNRYNDVIFFELGMGI